MSDLAVPSRGKPSAWREVGATMRLAVPIIVGLAASTLISVVDTIMIAPLGTEPMAGAALTTSALIILYSALYGLITVLGVELANHVGAGRPDVISALMRNGIVLALLAGLVVGLIMIAALPLLRFAGQPPEVLAIMGPYWITMAFVLVPFTVLFLFKGLYEAIGRPWLGAAFAMIAVVVNVPLNWALIHGLGTWPGLGLLGAGLASLASETIALILAWAFWRFSTAMAPYRARAALSVRTMLRQLRQGMPVALAYTGEGSSYAFIGLMLGWFGAAALAANQIVGAIGGVIYMLPLGMAAAVGIRIGQTLGEKKPERVRTIGLTAMGAVVTWMLIVTASLLLLREPIARSLSDDPEVIAIATLMFLTVAIMQVADGVQSTALGALRGLVDNTMPSIISLIAYWPIALPLAFLFGFTLGFGPNGVWIGYGLGLTCAATALLLRFLRKSAPDALTTDAPDVVKNAP